MKVKIITFSDIAKDPNLSLSAKHYINDDSIIDARYRDKQDGEKAEDEKE